jgi:hypothetical protein
LSKLTFQRIISYHVIRVCSDCSYGRSVAQRKVLQSSCHSCIGALSNVCLCSILCGRMQCSISQCASIGVTFGRIKKALLLSVTSVVTTTGVTCWTPHTDSLLGQSLVIWLFGYSTTKRGCDKRSWARPTERGVRKETAQMRCRRDSGKTGQLSVAGELCDRKQMHVHVRTINK